MSTKHTPGPWECDGRKYGTLTEYVEAKGRRVAAIYEVDINDDAEVEANARLIAAAPDLLEALKKTALFLSGEPNLHCDGWMSAALRDVRAAIAKAEGESK